jgi:hypothetical protein
MLMEPIMDALGINLPYLAIQFCLFGLFIALFVLPIAAIWQLRTRHFPNETDKLLWVIIIVMAPIIGAVGFFILQPGKESD